MKIERMSQRRSYGPVTLLHADRSGGPVLLEASSWRTVSGVMLNSRRIGCVTIMLRRVPSLGWRKARRS